MSDVRRAVAAVVAGLVMIPLTFGAVMAMEWPMNALPESLASALAALGGVALLAGFTLGWWWLYEWIGRRMDGRSF